MKTQKISKDLTIKVSKTGLRVFSSLIQADIAILTNIKPRDVDFTIAFLTFLYLDTEL